MALVTTFMTGPALDFINRFFKDTGPSANPEALQQAIRYKVLLSFKGAESGSKLVRLANSMISKLNGNATVTAMHLADETNLNNYSAEVYEQQSFTPVFTEARLLNQQLTTVFKVSNNIPFDTLQLSEKGDYDLLLLEPRMQLFETNLLAKSLGFKTAMAEYNRNSVADAFDDDTNAILQSSKIPVGIICGKEAGSINQIVVPVLSSSDQLLLPYLQRFISSNAAQVTVIDYEGLLKTNVAFKEALRMIEQTAPNHLRIENGGKTDTEELSKYDLILVSITGWNKLIKDKQLSVDDLPSVLVISLQSQ
jgi:hypothetical protein